MARNFRWRVYSFVIVDVFSFVDATPTPPRAFTLSFVPTPVGSSLTPVVCSWPAAQDGIDVVARGNVHARSGLDGVAGCGGAGDRASVAPVAATVVSLRALFLVVAGWAGRRRVGV